MEQLDLSRRVVLAQVHEVGDIPGVYHTTEAHHAAHKELQTRLKQIASPMPARQDPAVPNIQGTGIGLKFSSGRPTGQLVVTVMVVKKYPESKIPRESRIPESINGIATDVHECGVIRSHGFGRVARPIQCGAEIGSADPFPDGRFYAGTLGCLVIAGGKLCLLSNNHVLARLNEGQDGEDILQPAGGQVPGDLVGQLVGNYPQIDFSGGDTVVDAALAHTSWRDDFDLADPTFDDGTVMNPQAIAPVSGMTVHKFGFETGHTFGMIKDVPFSTDMDYTDVGGGSAHLTGQISITPMFGGSFSGAGDSGSLILTQGTNQPVALLVGGGVGVTVATPLEPIIQALKIQKFVAVKF